MDSSFFLLPNTSSVTSSSSAGSISPDLLDHSPSSLGYDPFEGFSLLDQHQGMRLYDYLGVSGRNSPLLNQCPLAAQLDHLDQLHQHHHHHLHHQHHHHLKSSFPFHSDPSVGPGGACGDQDDDLHEALSSFVNDLGNVDSDAGYTSGVDLFSSSTINDCSDSSEAYYLRLALEQNSSNLNLHETGQHQNHNHSSDINNNIDNHYYDYSNNYKGDSSPSSQQNYQSAPSTATGTTMSTKRSVLMNLLIDGSDVGAGYTSHNCRALPQRIPLMYHQQQQLERLNNNLQQQPIQH